MQSKGPGKGPLFSLRLDSLGVRVQPRVKISGTNLQAIGAKVQFTKLGMEKNKTRISKRAGAESKQHVEKDERSDSGCHGEVRRPGKPSRCQIAAARSERPRQHPGVPENCVQDYRLS